MGVARAAGHGPSAVVRPTGGRVPPRPPRPASARARLGALAVLAALCAVAGLRALPAARADDALPAADAVRLARAARGAVVRVQWRHRTRAADAVERHAVVVDPDGWLLLAGPRPSPEGTLAATFEDGRSMRAEVWGSDPRTSLTLLHVPVSSLPSIPLPSAPRTDASAGSAPTVPPRAPAGSSFVMVTAEGSLARGEVRGSHRHRLLEDPVEREGVEVTCLDEAALHVVPTDLGAPWIDADGCLVGLLVGAEVAPPAPSAPVDDLRLRPEVVAAYAVPAEVVRVVFPLLREEREVSRGALGVYVRRVSEAVRRHACGDGGGFEVVDLAPGGPAARAEVGSGDLVVRLGGHPIACEANLADALLPWRPGDRVRVGLLRRGRPLDVEVMLGRAP